MKELTETEKLQRGQIHPNSKFGKVLTELAKASNNIVEIGTWRGLGSTKCLHLGMVRPDQRMWTIELCEAQHNEAKTYYDDPRIRFLLGTLVRAWEVPAFEYPDQSFKQYYDVEVEINANAPYVFRKLPETIDLLLIDGGSWSGEIEFKKLAPRSKIIALDDTNPKREIKNVRTREQLIKDKWIVLHDEIEDRNGWAVFKRPEVVDVT